MARAAIHPGEHLAEQLQSLSMSAAEFARRIDVPTNRVTGLLNGQRSVSADTALRLSRAFNTSARFWMNLQVLHDLRKAEAASGTRMAQIEPVEPAGAVRAITTRRPRTEHAR